MPTIAEIRKRKKSLEQNILKVAKDFEQDGVQIDWIRIERNPDEEEKMMKFVADAPSTEGHGAIDRIVVELKIDLD